MALPHTSGGITEYERLRLEQMKKISQIFADCKLPEAVDAVRQAGM